jgi:hypothetical protein
VVRKLEGGGHELSGWGSAQLARDQLAAAVFGKGGFVVKGVDVRKAPGEENE